MRLSLIAAVAENGVIGAGDRLPWRLPADFRWFRQHTMGHHLLVGRRTWESIGKPLPGRSMVVLSRRRLALPAGVAAAGSIGEAVARAAAAGDSELFVGGGAEVYRQTLERADRLVLTRVFAEVAGDARFPSWEPSDWRMVYRREHPADERNALAMSFRVYLRAAAQQSRAPSNDSR